MALHLFSPFFPCNPTTRQELQTFKNPSNFRNFRLSRRIHCSAKTPPMRRSANYQQSLWSDSYIQSLKSDVAVDVTTPYACEEEKDATRIEELKNNVRRLIKEESGIVDKFELVDTLQQLGVAYHFKEEIKDLLATISESLEKSTMVVNDDLHTTSLIFRLLREHGFRVSQDIFKNFKDDMGNFMTSHSTHPTKAILSLYEASYFAMEGEDMLDEARDFSTKYLKNLLESSQDLNLRNHVAHALELPLNWRMSRLHTRWFIEEYQKQGNVNPILLEFAKLDFNLVQSIYTSELKQLSRWWTDLNLNETLPFARDRLVEHHLWSIGWAFEPQLGMCREAQTKANSLVSTIDDIYDVYGTLDELQLFTDAVDRWDVSAIKQLPEYMKICFLALFNTTNDTAYKVLKVKGLDVIPCLKKGWADLCKAYLVEAKWYHQGYTPTFEDYLENALVSISGPVMLTLAYSTSEDLTQESLERFWTLTDTMRQSCILFRLYNDLETSSAELKRGDVPKSIQCYMHEKGVTEAMAHEHIKELINANWKKLNGAGMANSSFEEYLKSIAISIARMSQCMYQYGDGHGKPDQDTKDRVISMFFKPILP